MLQVTTIAILSSNENRFVGFEVADEADYILVSTGLQDTDLCLDEFLKFWGINKKLLSDDFDGHDLFIPIVNSLVDCRPSTLP